ALPVDRVVGVFEGVRQHRSHQLSDPAVQQRMSGLLRISLFMAELPEAATGIPGLGVLFPRVVTPTSLVGEMVVDEAELLLADPAKAQPLPGEVRGAPIVPCLHTMGADIGGGASHKIERGA